eukprot:4628409-Pleurochrysis_carterae.AAC.1
MAATEVWDGVGSGWLHSPSWSPPTPQAVPRGGGSGGGSDSSGCSPPAALSAPAPLSRVLVRAVGARARSPSPAP